MRSDVMATTLPRPSRPSNTPPTSTLPAIPMPKTRKSTGGIALASPGGSRSGLRSPSVSPYPPPSPAPTSALPTPRSIATPNGKTLRKTVSINSFPHPPKGDYRVSSLPPSPLSGGGLSVSTPLRKSRTPTATPKASHMTSSLPSLLNGTAEGKSVRNSDALISVGSPTQSRSSSAQDSYSTSATTYDDPADGAASSVADRRTSKGPDGKGNVIVSVRVRPDAASNDGRAEGEWMVDGRKSLVSYRGKEGGDYFYGASLCEERMPTCC
jgi:centromeric protein E